MAITAAMVKELRAQSGAGIMDAKNALQENDGDLEAAIDWLRSKGKSKAAKKSSRTAADGLAGVFIDNGTGVIVEVNSETDFVAKNAEFRELVDLVRRTAIKVDNLGDLLNAQVDDESVSELIASKIASLGENITIARLEKIAGENIASYVHAAIEDGMGKIAVLVIYDGPKSELGKQVAMHVAATNPIALSEEDVPAEKLERERQILTQKALDAGKPAGIVERIVEGGIKKFLAEETLINQKFVINPDQTVKAATADAEITIKGFVRVQVGEGR